MYNVYISDVFVRTSVKNRTLEYDVWITNGSGHTRTVGVIGALASHRERLFQYPGLPRDIIAFGEGERRKITVRDVIWDLGPESY